MTQRRVLMVGLDGFDICLAERFLDEGALPNFARLRDRSMRFDLDHGVDKYSGLAWEHVSAGQAPNDGARWSAVTFDPGDLRHLSRTYIIAPIPCRRFGANSSV